MSFVKETWNCTALALLSVSLSFWQQCKGEKLLSTGHGLKNTFSSSAYQVRLVSILLLLPRFYRLLFFLRLAIIDLQPPFGQEQNGSVRSGPPKISPRAPPVPTCTFTELTEFQLHQEKNVGMAEEEKKNKIWFQNKVFQLNFNLFDNPKPASCPYCISKFGRKKASRLF